MATSIQIHRHFSLRNHPHSVGTGRLNIKAQKLHSYSKTQHKINKGSRGGTAFTIEWKHRGDVWRTRGERIHLYSLLEKIASPSMSEQRKAAKELRCITKRIPSFRALIGETPNATTQLLSLLSNTDVHHPPEVQEDIVTTILNLSIHDTNKKIVGEAPKAIPLLVEALKSGSRETRSNAAAALFTLSALDTNKINKIGESGAIRPLVELLEQGSSMAKKDTASAIFNLCILHENKAMAVNDGAVRIPLSMIMDQSCMDESLALLAILSSSVQAVEEMGECGVLLCMLSIIREGSCGRNTENAVAIFYSICCNDRTKLREIREEEKNYSILAQLSQNGTARARRKASRILGRLRRTTNTT